MDVLITQIVIRLLAYKLFSNDGIGQSNLALCTVCVQGEVLLHFKLHPGYMCDCSSNEQQTQLGNLRGN